MSSNGRNGNGNYAQKIHAKSGSNAITVLDVGSAKTVALICEITDAGLIRLRGLDIGSRLSRRRRTTCLCNRCSRTTGQRVTAPWPRPVGR